MVLVIEYPLSLTSGFSASSLFGRFVSAYSHAIDLDLHGPQGGPTSSHLTLRRLQVTQPSRDFRCGRRVAMVFRLIFRGKQKHQHLLPDLGRARPVCGAAAAPLGRGLQPSGYPARRYCGTQRLPNKA